MLDPKGPPGKTAPQNLHFTLVVRSAGVFEPASVLNGDGLANLGAGAAAFEDDGLGDAHF